MADNKPTPIEDNLNRRLLRLDAQIKTEYDLIGHRVSWLLTSSSFLFAAFLVGLNNTNPLVNKYLIEELTFWLPVTGLVSSLLVWFALFAAASVIRKLKKLRDIVEDKATSDCNFEVLGIRIISWQHIVGNLPAFLLPPLLAFIWARLLYLGVIS